MNWGSVDSFQVWMMYSSSPNARRIRETPDTQLKPCTFGYAYVELTVFLVRRPRADYYGDGVKPAFTCMFTRHFWRARLPYCHRRANLGPITLVPPANTSPRDTEIILVSSDWPMPY